MHKNKVMGKPLILKRDAAPPRATRERIITRSILLFNRNGLRDVAIERIAKDLKLSPGNVTYHFPRKQQLIVATLEVVKDGLRKALEQPTAVKSARDGSEYLLRLYSTLWEYRFFFNALTYVLTDPQLHREYTEFRAWALKTIERDVTVLCDHGFFLQPTAPNNFALLSANMWSLWLNWLRVHQVMSPSADKPGNAALYDCAIQHWSLCQPWMRPDYARELFDVFSELQDDAVPPKPAAGRKRKTGGASKP